MQTLGVFAKFWAAQRVKTRLAATIGHPAAAALHKAFLQATLSRHSRSGDQRWVVFTPAERQQAFSDLAGNAWKLVAQRTGDLGQRLQPFFTDHLSVAGNAVVVLGADTPDLPRDLVEQAFSALESSSVVLGPSEDGGYYLLGLRQDVPSLFERMPWGTDRVLETSLSRLAEAKIEPVILPPWHDVDRGDDLDCLRQLLRTASADEPELILLAEQIENILASVDRPT